MWNPIRTSALLTGLAGLAISSSAAAYVPPAGHGQLSDTRLEVAGQGQATRTSRDVIWNRVPPRAARAWQRLRDEAPGARASWDRATGVPSRIIGHSVEVPSSVASPEVAEQYARGFLNRHLDVLAPGSKADDFELVSNHLDPDAGIRSVGFVQKHAGARVLGGQVSFRFKHDRLLAIGSEALPNIQLTRASAAARAPASIVESAAIDWTEAVLDVDSAGLTGGVDGPFILPLVADGRVLGYREVMRARVDGVSERGALLGRWRVYVDAVTGEAVAREQTLRYADATLQLNVYDRNPIGPRGDYPAAYVGVTVAGNGTTTNVLGGFTIPDGGADVSATVSGQFATVLTETGPQAARDFAIGAGQTYLWSEAGDEHLDAQLNAKVHTELVKEYIRLIAPSFDWLNQSMNVTVNIEDICNAYSDGHDIFFFTSGSGCENTALISDVVYHEMGHSVHRQALIEGVGAFEGALSEGISDYIAATIVDDSGMGRGFFQTADALRELDPPGYEWHWPEDRGEVHDEGRIIGGTLWDLRAALINKLGYAPGKQRADHIWFQSIRRAVDIPSMYVEALVADDDDGNLANGTPNVCEINAAFAAHGLRSVTAEVADVSVGLDTPEGHPVEAVINGLFPQCGDTISGATIHWQVRGQEQIAGSVQMSQIGDVLGGVIPRQPEGTVVQYKIVFNLDGTQQELPRNIADPRYEFYVGEVSRVYCTSFEDNPLAEGWTTGADFGKDDWEWAPAGLLPESDDPSSAFSGGFVFGNDLGLAEQDGRYPANTRSVATSPIIGVEGYQRVRLQYRRWLSVEDGIFDNATVTAFGTPVWSNFASEDFSLGATHHLDGEWRFHDVDVTDYVQNGRVQVGFELQTDGGLEFGGWTLDEFCIVGVNEGFCGDGVVDFDNGEECDDGNTDDGDGCDADCQPEPPPPPPDDDDDDDDDGDDDDDDDDDDDTDTDTDTAGSDLADRGCGCVTSDQPGGGLAGLALGLLVLSLRRRRRP